MLITGGTGGLGRAVVAAFAADGWRVVVLDTRDAELEGAEVVQADLTDADDVARAVAAATGDAAAPLRAVVNLVGGFAAASRSRTTPVEDFEAQFALNLRPTYLVTQAALPALVAAGGGAIVCVSLALGAAPVRRRRRLLRVEGRGDHVRAGRRARARRRRRALQRGAAADDRHARQPRDDAARAARALPRRPRSRAVIRFLCSDESAPTTARRSRSTAGPDQPP